MKKIISNPKNEAMITNNIINGETRVRFYAVTNNGKQKKMLADWYIYDTEKLIHSSRWNN